MNRNGGNLQATVQIMVRRLVRAHPCNRVGLWVPRPRWVCGTSYVPPLGTIVRFGKNVHSKATRYLDEKGKRKGRGYLRKQCRRIGS